MVDDWTKDDELDDELDNEDEDYASTSGDSTDSRGLVFSPEPLRPSPSRGNVTNRHGSADYSEIIDRHAQRTGLDRNLIAAVMGHESNNYARARSSKGAQGLMQLIPATAARYNVTDPFDPEQNIRGGSDYLRDLSRRYHGNTDLILAAYNAGEGAVDKYGGRVPPYAETRAYVPAVKARIQQLQQSQGQSGVQPSTQGLVFSPEPLPAQQERSMSEVPRVPPGTGRFRPPTSLGATPSRGAVAQMPTREPQQPQQPAAPARSPLELLDVLTNALQGQKRTPSQPQPSTPPLVAGARVGQPTAPPRPATLVDRAQQAFQRMTSALTGGDELSPEYRVQAGPAADPRQLQVASAQAQAEQEREGAALASAPSGGFPTRERLNLGRTEQILKTQDDYRARLERNAPLVAQAKAQAKQLIDQQGGWTPGLDKWLTETFMQSAAHLGEELAGGALQASTSYTLGRALRTGQTLNQVSEENPAFNYLWARSEGIRQAADEASHGRSWLSKEGQGALAGLMSPEIAATALGVPAGPAFAGAGFSGALGRGATVPEALQEGGTQYLVGSLFDAPVSGSVTAQAAKKAGVVGAGTLVATGDPKSAASNMLFAASGPLLHGEPNVPTSDPAWIRWNSERAGIIPEGVRTGPVIESGTLNPEIADMVGRGAARAGVSPEATAAATNAPAGPTEVFGVPASTTVAPVSVAQQRDTRREAMQQIAEEGGTVTTASVNRRAAELEGEPLRQGGVTTVTSQGRQYSRDAAGNWTVQLPGSEQRHTVTHTGTIAQLNQLAGGEVQAPQASQTQPSGVPEWVQASIREKVALANQWGIADRIEELSAQRLTANQIAPILARELSEAGGGRHAINAIDGNEVNALIRAVRADRGIPSMDQHTEFDAWLNSRNQSRDIVTARHGTVDPQAAIDIIRGELRPGSSISRSGGKDYEGHPIILEFTDNVNDAQAYSSPYGPTMHEGAATTTRGLRGIKRVLFDPHEFIHREDATQVYNELRKALDETGRKNVPIEAINYDEATDSYKYGGKVDLTAVPTFDQYIKKASDRDLNSDWDHAMNAWDNHREAGDAKAAGEAFDRAGRIAEELERRQGGTQTVDVNELRPEHFSGKSESEKASLPRELAGAKPRYSYGRKQFTLNFEDDFDRAAYITAQSKPSARDADYLAWATQHSGLDEESVRAHGRAVRELIKFRAKNSTADSLTIPRVPRATDLRMRNVLNPDDVMRYITKEEQVERGVFEYAIRLPDKPTVRVKLSMMEDGKTARVDVGGDRNGSMTFDVNTRNVLGSEAVLALRRLLAREHPEIKRLAFTRVKWDDEGFARGLRWKRSLTLREVRRPEEVKPYITKVDNAYSTWNGHYHVYDINLPDKPPVRVMLDIKDGVAKIYIGTPTGRTIDFIHERRNQLGMDTVLALRRLLRTEHPEVKRLEFSRIRFGKPQNAGEKTLTVDRAPAQRPDIRNRAGEPLSDFLEPEGGSVREVRRGDASKSEQLPEITEQLRRDPEFDRTARVLSSTHPDWNAEQIDNWIQRNRPDLFGDTGVQEFGDVEHPREGDSQLVRHAQQYEQLVRDQLSLRDADHPLASMPRSLDPEQVSKDEARRALDRQEHQEWLRSPDGRTTLERYASDPNPEFAEAARRKLDEIDGLQDLTDSQFLNIRRIAEGAWDERLKNRPITDYPRTAQYRTPDGIVATNGTVKAAQLERMSDDLPYSRYEPEAKVLYINPLMNEFLGAAGGLGQNPARDVSDRAGFEYRIGAHVKESLDYLRREADQTEQAMHALIEEHVGNPQRAMQMQEAVSKFWREWTAAGEQSFRDRGDVSVRVAVLHPWTSVRDIAHVNTHEGIHHADPFTYRGDILGRQPGWNAWVDYVDSLPDGQGWAELGVNQYDLHTLAAETVAHGLTADHDAEVTPLLRAALADIITDLYNQHGEKLLDELRTKVPHSQAREWVNDLFQDIRSQPKDPRYAGETAGQPTESTRSITRGRSRGTERDARRDLERKPDAEELGAPRRSVYVALDEVGELPPSRHVNALLEKLRAPDKQAMLDNFESGHIRRVVQRYSGVDYSASDPDRSFRKAWQETPKADQQIMLDTARKVAAGRDDFTPEEVEHYRRGATSRQHSEASVFANALAELESDPVKFFQGGTGVELTPKGQQPREHFPEGPLHGESEYGGNRLREIRRGGKAKDEDRLSHPDPEHHGKPILATDDQGRAVVSNPANKSGVSRLRTDLGEPNRFAGLSDDDLTRAWGRAVSQERTLRQTARQTEGHADTVRADLARDEVKEYRAELQRRGLLTSSQEKSRRYDGPDIRKNLTNIREDWATGKLTEADAIDYLRPQFGSFAHNDDNMRTVLYRPSDPLLGIIDRQGVVRSTENTFRHLLHGQAFPDMYEHGSPERWRYEPSTKTVYWDGIPTSEERAAVTQHLEAKGLEVAPVEADLHDWTKSLKGFQEAESEQARRGMKPPRVMTDTEAAPAESTEEYIKRAVKGLTEEGRQAVQMRFALGNHQAHRLGLTAASDQAAQSYFRQLHTFVSNYMPEKAQLVTDAENAYHAGNYSTAQLLTERALTGAHDYIERITGARDSAMVMQFGGEPKSKTWGEVWTEVQRRWKRQGKPLSMGGITYDVNKYPEGGLADHQKLYRLIEPVLEKLRDDAANLIASGKIKAGDAADYIKREFALMLRKGELPNGPGGAHGAWHEINARAGIKLANDYARKLRWNEDTRQFEDPGQLAVRHTPATLEAAGYPVADDLIYRVKTDEASLAAAQQTIHALGEEGATRYVLDWDKQPSKEQIVTAGVLAAQRRGTPAANDLLNDMYRKLTTAGQVVQAARFLSQMTPEGIVNAANLDVKRQAKGDPQAKISSADERVLTDAAEEAEAADREPQRLSKALEAVDSEQLARATTKVEKQARTVSGVRKARKAARRMAKQQTRAIDIWIDSLGTNDTADVVAGAHLMAQKGSIKRSDWATRMAQRGVDTTDAKGVAELFKRSYELHQEARTALARERITKGEQMSDAEVENLLWQKRQAIRDAQQARMQLARTYNRIVMPPLEKARNFAVDLINIPKAIKASYDVSAVGRQGWILLSGAYQHDLQTAALTDMLRSGISKNYFDAKAFDLTQHPRFEQAERSGLFLAEKGARDVLSSWTNREENFASKIAEKIPGVGMSERAYTSYLDSVRLGYFDMFAKEFEERGMTEVNSPHEYKALANMLNTFTGRGELGKAITHAAPVLNALTWSPRFMKSRFQILNPLWYVRMPEATRRIAVRTAMRSFGTTLGAMGLVAAGASLAKRSGYDTGVTVNFTDPDSADWLRLKSGNLHIDPLAGEQPVARYLWRMMKSAYDRTQGGTQAIAAENPINITLDFLRGKEAPIPAWLDRAWTGVDRYGSNQSYKPIFDFAKSQGVDLTQVPYSQRATNILVNLFAPMIAEDMMQAGKQDGWWGAASAGASSGFGFGAMTYKDTGPRSPAEKLLMRLASQGGQIRQSDESQEKHDLKMDIKDAMRGGEKVDSRIDEAVKGGQLSAQDIRDLYRQGNQSRLADLFGNVKLEYAVDAYGLMTPEERKEIEPLMWEKYRSGYPAMTPRQQNAIDEKMRALGLLQAQPVSRRSTYVPPRRAGEDDLDYRARLLETGRAQRNGLLGPNDRDRFAASKTVARV